MTAPVTSTTDIMAWLHATAAGSQLCSDSRAVEAGDVFFGYPGDVADGRAFIAHAIQKGAKAVVYEAQSFIGDDAWNLPHLAVIDLKKIAGPVANAWYGRPDENMFTVAVTGTNGKTSCSQWLGSALSQLGMPTAVVGTLGAGLFERGEPGQFELTGYTTPDAVQFQRKLSHLHRAGATALAVEASSIGLDQGRLNGMHVDVALFTNFTRDHLDYHGDMATYEAAKTMLFDWPGLQHAVVNLDDDMGLRLIQRLRQTGSPATVIGYTITSQVANGVAALRASDIQSSSGGTSFLIESRFGSGLVKTQLVGQFNVSNVLGIIGVLLAKGISWEATLAAAEALTAVPGRMQQLGGQGAPLVVIDYAHTPDALEKTLVALRQVARQRSGRLWCVFGCGGDRDPGKRPQMGVASTAADHVIVTSDNPRSENPTDIIAQVIEGMNATTFDHQARQTIEDRAAAILWAVKYAGKSDVILLAGKGHEAYQEIKERKQPFLDADHAALALAARATMNGGH